MASQTTSEHIAGFSQVFVLNDPPPAAISQSAARSSQQKASSRLFVEVMDH